MLVGVSQKTQYRSCLKQDYRGAHFFNFIRKLGSVSLKLESKFKCDCLCKKISFGPKTLSSFIF